MRAILHKLWLVLIFVPFLLLCTSLTVLAALLLRFAVGERRAGASVGPLWARLLAIMLPVSVRISGIENIDKSRAYVVISNHESQLDILALYGRMGIDLRWILKQEIRKLPLIGWGSRAVGHVFVDRNNRKTAIASIKAAVRKLEPGEGMLFFPEGTRSKSGLLLPFKSGAFRTALQLQMPILPVSIAGTWELMPPGQMLPKAGTIRLLVHPAIETSGLSDSGQQARRLMDIARTQIQNGINRMETQQHDLSMAVNSSEN